MSLLSAGECREKIRIEQPSDTTNAYGETTHVWSEMCTRWAKVVGKRVLEQVNGVWVQAVGTHEVSFRPYTPGIDSGMRVVWTSRSPSRTLDIVEVREIGNREGVTLICKEQR